MLERCLDELRPMHPMSPLAAWAHEERFGSDIDNRPNPSSHNHGPISFSRVEEPLAAAQLLVAPAPGGTWGIKFKPRTDAMHSYCSIVLTYWSVLHRPFESIFTKSSSTKATVEQQSVYYRAVPLLEKRSCKDSPEIQNSWQKSGILLHCTYVQL